MNKKIIAGIIALIIIVIAGYTFFYAPYQEKVLSEQFDGNLQNASAIEKEITATTEAINKKETNDVDTLINTINNDITPKYFEELKILNESDKFANNNETKIQYLANQTRRIELQSQNYNATIKILNALSQMVKGEKSAEEAQNSITRANIEMEDCNKELNEVYDNITNILKENPDFNQTLHDLKLEKGFYGEKVVVAQTQNIENTTA
ncbi:MAG: hypothetical protein BZ138_02825 [Methanosphaera sp. rholeuAM270]|nr:MAG: hypothetical protein BZ138_02825 [Methanosphaera sp. rholeuAM270]